MAGLGEMTSFMHSSESESAQRSQYIVSPPEGTFVIHGLRGLHAVY